LNTCFGEIGAWHQKPLEANLVQNIYYQSLTEIIPKNKKMFSKNIDVIREMIRVAPAAATGRHLEVRK